MKVDQNSTCPCGSEKLFASCCMPFLEGKKQATTPEQLMRSRYTAFVAESEDYILQTWHSRTRPKHLNFADHPVVWLGLNVDPVKHPDMTANEGIVSFTASYLEEGQLCHLHETSTFLLENGRWFYLKGNCDVDRAKIGRNDQCPCNSGKKFKKCCMPR